MKQFFNIIAVVLLTAAATLVGCDKGPTNPPPPVEQSFSITWPTEGVGIGRDAPRTLSVAFRGWGSQPDVRFRVDCGAAPYVVEGRFGGFGSEVTDRSALLNWSPPRSWPFLPSCTLWCWVEVAEGNGPTDDRIRGDKVGIYIGNPG